MRPRRRHGADFNSSDGHLNGWLGGLPFLFSGLDAHQRPRRLSEYGCGSRRFRGSRRNRYYGNFQRELTRLRSLGNHLVSRARTLRFESRRRRGTRRFPSGFNRRRRRRPHHRTHDFGLTLDPPFLGLDPFRHYHRFVWRRCYRNARSLAKRCPLDRWRRSRWWRWCDVRGRRRFFRRCRARVVNQGWFHPLGSGRERSWNVPDLFGGSFHRRRERWSKAGDRFKQRGPPPLEDRRAIQRPVEKRRQKIGHRIQPPTISRYSRRRPGLSAKMSRSLQP